jgi:predicted acylesterase/phospholipase RssA
MRGLAHIGALEVLEAKGYLKAVKEYVGISAGAFIAFAICIGCTLPELRKTVTLLDFGLIRSLSPEDVFRFMDTFGFDTGENIDRLITAMLRSKGMAPTTTFRELAKRPGPALRMFATELNTCSQKEFSARTTPETEVKSALRASMCIPIYFTPVNIDGRLMVDGGVVTNSPFFVLSDEERETTLAIAFADKHKPKASIPDLPNFLAQIYYSIDYHHLRSLDKAWSKHIVYLPCGDFSMIHFEASAEEKEGLLAMGRKGMEDFLGGRFGRAPPRRFSVV